MKRHGVTPHPAPERLIVGDELYAGCVRCGPHQGGIDADRFGAESHPGTDALRARVDRHRLAVEFELKRRERLQRTSSRGFQDRTRRRAQVVVFREPLACPQCRSLPRPGTNSTRGLGRQPPCMPGTSGSRRRGPAIADSNRPHSGHSHPASTSRSSTPSTEQAG